MIIDFSEYNLGHVEVCGVPGTGGGPDCENVTIHGINEQPLTHGLYNVAIFGDQSEGTEASAFYSVLTDEKDPVLNWALVYIENTDHDVTQQETQNGISTWSMRQVSGFIKGQEEDEATPRDWATVGVGELVESVSSSQEDASFEYGDSSGNSVKTIQIAGHITGHITENGDLVFPVQLDGVSALVKISKSRVQDNTSEESTVEEVRVVAEV